jgi:hypothetical protein
MIATKGRENQPRVAVVTHSGMRTRLDAMKKLKGVEQWIRKESEPMVAFNPQK